MQANSYIQIGRVLYAFLIWIIGTLSHILYVFYIWIIGIAFVLLCILGGKMIVESFKKEDCLETEVFLNVKEMLPLAVATVGVRIGHAFGIQLKSKAEIAGGVILILIGLKILLEHTGILNF